VSFPVSARSTDGTALHRHIEQMYTLNSKRTMRLPIAALTEPCPLHHCRKEWDDIRPFLLEIYHRPGTRLDDAMEIMATQYGSHATKTMYKKRLHGWGVKKNLKSTDKDLILSQAQLERQPQHLRRKVLRYAREKRRQNTQRDWRIAFYGTKPHRSQRQPCTQVYQSKQEMADFDNHDVMATSTTPSTALATPAETETPSSGNSIACLTVSDHIKDRQLLVHSLQECMLLLDSGHGDCPFSESNKPTRTLPKVFGRECWAQEMYFAFYLGSEALALGLFNNATSHFRTADRHLVRCLTRPTQQLLVDLLDLIRVFSLGWYKAYASVMYRLLASIVRDRLGRYHPMAAAIGFIVQHADDLEWQRATWESLSWDEDPNDRERCNCVRLQAQSHYGLLLESHKCLEDSISINVRLLEKELTLLGLNHEATRRTMLLLGRLHRRTKNFDRAVQGLHHALELIQSQPAPSLDHTVHLLIYSELARTHERLGNHGAAMNWYWQVFHESNIVYGGKFEDSIWHLDELFAFFRRHPKVDEFRRISDQIKQEFSESYQLMTLGLENLRSHNQSLPEDHSFRSVLSTRAMPSRRLQGSLLP
jgi:tetratricopeptide (TPR) repeat protein